jgi:hypothetical protein
MPLYQKADGLSIGTDGIDAIFHGRKINKEVLFFLNV